MSIGPPAATPAVDNRIPNGALPWAWSIRRMLASPTCRVATLAVFAGILAIEAVIFVPAYLNREQALLAQARDHAEPTRARSSRGAAVSKPYHAHRLAYRTLHAERLSAQQFASNNVDEPRLGR